MYKFRWVTTQFNLSGTHLTKISTPLLSIAYQFHKLLIHYIWTLWMGRSPYTATVNMSYIKYITITRCLFSLVFLLVLIAICQCQSNTQKRVHAYCNNLNYTMLPHQRVILKFNKRCKPLRRSQFCIHNTANIIHEIQTLKRWPPANGRPNLPTKKAITFLYTEHKVMQRP